MNNCKGSTTGHQCNCTVSRQQLENAGIYVGQNCAECGHIFGEHRDENLQTTGNLFFIYF